MMSRMIGRSFLFRLGVVGIVATFAFAGSQALAVHENVDYPVAIHAGTCDAPGDVVVELGNVTRLPVEAPDEGEPVGAAGSQVVHGFEDEVELDLTVDDLLAADHLVAVFDAEGNIVACGPVGQYTFAEGEDLAFGLRPAGEESPWNGVVLVDSEDDDDQLEVEIYLVNNTVPPMATPAATPVT